MRATSSTRTPTTPSAAGRRHDDRRLGRERVHRPAAATDTLSGNGGTDPLIGGRDADKLFGGAGIDTLDSADNVADTMMDCGSGTPDVLNRDLQDIEATGCENVNSVGILKLAPTAISAEAGRGRQGQAELDAPEELEAAPPGDAAAA